MFCSFPVALLSPGPGGGGGGGGGVVVTATPSSQDGSGFGRTFLFPSPVVINVTGGSPSAYTWSFRNVVGGGWSVFSGQGTATATAQVTGIPTGGEVFAELACAVTVSGVDYVASCQLGYVNIGTPPSGERPD